jgi:hypothetical protein
MSAPRHGGRTEALARTVAICCGGLLLAIVVFLTGAAIVRLRFTGAGIPGRDVFNHVSLGEVLVIGGVHLGLFALAGFLAILVALWIDRTHAPGNHYLAAAGFGTVGVIVAIGVFEGEVLPKLLASLLTVLAASFAWLATGSRARGRAWEWIESRRPLVLWAELALALSCVLVLVAAEEPWFVVLGAVLAIALLSLVVRVLMHESPGRSRA